MDGLSEKCGVFGVYAPEEDVARLTFFGIYSLQHRGQESAGIAASDGHQIRIEAGMGLVSQAFDEQRLGALPGIAAIGHTRYSTTGSTLECNTQPLLVNGVHGEYAVAHNGNVVNAKELKSSLGLGDHFFESTTDSEVLARILSDGPGRDLNDRFAYMMTKANGAYSLAVLTPDALYATRDPLGIRPLCIGKLPSRDDGGGGWVVSSESCALDHLGATVIRDVAPGEVVKIDSEGITSFFPLGEKSDKADKDEKLCLFEFIYFARPDSILSGSLLHEVRRRMGARLAQEHPAEADIVIGVPDSATPAAIGYAEESGIPYVEALVKNRYVGRTFIKPDQRLRERDVELKLNPLKHVLEGKRVLVVDDSIVRGTTTPRVVRMLREAGAKEIHMRISAPPITHPCPYGTDMATRGELIAAQNFYPDGRTVNVDAIENHVGADSLRYISLEGASWATRRGSGHCAGCFTGKYPSEGIPLQLDKFELESGDERGSMPSILPLIRS